MNKNVTRLRLVPSGEGGASAKKLDPSVLILAAIAIAMIAVFTLPSLFKNISKAEKTATRQEGRTDRTDARQSGRSDRKESKMEYKEAVVKETGQTPFAATVTGILSAPFIAVGSIFKKKD